MGLLIFVWGIYTELQNCLYQTAHDPCLSQSLIYFYLSSLSQISLSIYFCNMVFNFLFCFRYLSVLFSLSQISRCKKCLLILIQVLIIIKKSIFLLVQLVLASQLLQIPPPSLKVENGWSPSPFFFIIKPMREPCHRQKLFV